MIRKYVEKMSRVEAARLGGLARQAAHGDLGTIEGRRKGGLRSLSTHEFLNTNFKRLRQIKLPRASPLLAEFIGIVAGDGHVDTYQVGLTTNSETDRLHAEHFAMLAKKLFDLDSRITFRKTSKACVVTLSSKALCDYLHSQGLPNGSKVQLGVAVPLWIVRNDVFALAYARGLFDSDGCVYQDNHVIKGKQYSHLGLAFANSEPHLLDFFKKALERAGLKPTQKSKFRVFLRRAGDIERYFKMIGSSNPKHLDRYKMYRRDTRRGA